MISDPPLADRPKKTWAKSQCKYSDCTFIIKSKSWDLLKDYKYTEKQKLYFLVRSQYYEHNNVCAMQIHSSKVFKKGSWRINMYCLHFSCCCFTFQIKNMKNHDREVRVFRNKAELTHNAGYTQRYFANTEYRATYYADGYEI